MLLSKTLANHYELKGNIDVTFGQDFGGNPHIVYNNKAYSGVTVTDTEAGKIASVVIDFAPDAYTKFLCLIIPPVNLNSSGNDQKVETTAVIATHKTSIAGPNLVEGQLIDYKYEPLSGTASYVLS